MIISIDTIKREAEQAAEAGKSPDEACRWPFHSPEGEVWQDAYRACREAKQAEAVSA